MQVPEVSVIVPCRDEADNLAFLIDEIATAMNGWTFEVIVVDDGSSDATAGIVNEFSSRDSMVRLCRSATRSGAQAARNVGIRHATGEWIAFQDSDDEWGADKLAVQVRHLEEVGADPMTVIHGDAWRCHAGSAQREYWRLPLVEGERPVSRLLRAPGPIFPAMLTSKIALERIGLLDEAVPSYQEWDTAIRLAGYCRFVHVRDALVTYHLHGGETISKDMRRDIRGYQYIVDKFRNDILTSCGRVCLDSHIRRNAHRALEYGLHDEALQVLAAESGWSVKGLLMRVLARLRVTPQAYAKWVRRGRVLPALGHYVRSRMATPS